MTLDFVFDFDLTLTNKTSNGIKKHAVANNYIELFDSENKLDELKKHLRFIKQKGHNIFINTRALVSDVNHIIKYIGIDNMIDEIKGSRRIENINKPFSEIELNKYGLMNITNIEILWAIKKVIFLNEIKEKNSNNILFFDDSIININTAKLNGYENSFLIGSNDSGIFGLDYLLIKLDEIFSSLL